MKKIVDVDWARVKKMYIVAARFDKGEFQEEDVAYMKELAEKGIPVAEYYYALINYRGRIKGADLEIAEDYFKKCLQHCSLGIAKKIFIVTNISNK